MATPRVLLPVISLLLLLITVPATAATGIYTIRLTSGETLENVAGEVDQQFKVMKLEDGRAISFADIAGIQNGGVDVTRAILGRDARNTSPSVPEGSSTGPATGSAPEPGPAPSMEPGEQPAVESTDAPAQSPWLSESSEAFREARRPLWRWGIKAGGNFSSPMGNYYDGFGSGAGYDVEVWAAVYLAEEFANRDKLAMAISNEGCPYEVQGALLSYKKGSGFMRFLIGFGAGNSKVVTELEMIDTRDGSTVFGGNFTGEVASWTDSGDKMFKMVSRNFTKQLEKRALAAIER